ncbi:MAG: thioredoxin [Bacteroidetes bacterium]|jgi:thiol-disulfide isomerase/thioredoxin|nr:thioredoxin [Bacteroidota bacterium]
MKNLELILFSSQKCSVCQAIKPKIERLAETFKNVLRYKFIQVDENPELRAHYQVFTCPTLLVMIENKEYYRFIRSFSITEVENKLNRFIQLVG